MIISKEEILSHPNDSDLGYYVRNKFNIEEQEINDYDYCVLCGKKSPYKKTTHIDERIGYVEGAGQACFQPNKCY